MRSIKFEFDIWTCNQKIGPNLFSGHYLLTISSTCVIEAGERSFHEASPLAVVRWTTRGGKVTNCSKAMSTKEHRRDNVRILSIREHEPLATASFPQEMPVDRCT